MGTSHVNRINSTMASSVVAKAKAKAAAAMDSAERAFLDRCEGYIDRALERTGPKVADSLKDPDMPLCVAQAVDATVAEMWPDVHDEVMGHVHETLLSMNKKSVDWSYLQPKEPVTCAKAGACGCLRALILYPLFPYDLTIWGQIKRVSFWILQIPNVIPVFGIQQFWWAFLFLLRDKSDDFQLTNFIVSFKGIQFFTIGI